MYLLPPRARFASSIGNGLFNSASLDLPFAKTKSLVDAVTGRNLVTFTRASSGTYVDSQGVIRTATTNLFLNSEALGSWGSGTRASVSSNTIAAPDDRITADTLVEDNTASSTHEIINTAGVSFVSGLAYTFSVYVKAKERSQVTLFLPGAAFGSGTAQEVLFNLSTATTSTLTGSPTSSSIVAVGDGWYRCSVTASASTTATGFPRFRLASGGTNSYTGDGTSGIYLWGAQLEQSSTVGEYIPTTSTINSAPRFDHNPTTGESLGLLVEEQRTNSLLNSEDFTAASWGTLGGTVTGNTVNSPAGTLTADSFAENNGSTDPRMPVIFSFVAGTNYTLSVYAKVIPGSAQRYLMLVYNSGYALTSGANFNLVAGTVGATSNATGSIQVLPNGWYRCSMTPNANATGSGALRIRIASVNTSGNINGPSAYTGDGTSGFYLWGAQLEAGAFPTSYISTTTATVTRSADVASITGTNFSSWYRQDEGTVFYDGQALGSDPVTNKNLLGVSNGSGNNTIDFFIPSGLNQRFRIVNGGVSQALQNTLPTANVYSPAKVACAFKLDDATSAGNGTVLATDTSCTIPSVDRFTFGVLTTGEAQVAARYKRLTFWPQRLPNQTLQRITQ